MTALAKIEALDPIAELDHTNNLCQRLMKTPHYQKMGAEGIYAIVQKAKSMGINPLDALNGSFYCIGGKIEMSGQAMLALIRSHGHSVSMDPKSTDTKVIMYGKRCDNNDTWRAEFSVEDAKRAGIYRQQWEKQPRVMCMWRCVSQLGRFLFSDVLKGVYVQGEISESIAASNHTEPSLDMIVEVVKPMLASKQQGDELEQIVSKCSTEYQDTVCNFFRKTSIKDFYSIPMDVYQRLLTRAKAEDKAQREYLDRMSSTSENKQPKIERYEDEIVDAITGEINE